jgi:hypothetical protein
MPISGGLQPRQCLGAHLGARWTGLTTRRAAPTARLPAEPADFGNFLQPFFNGLSKIRPCPESSAGGQQRCSGDLGSHLGVRWTGDAQSSSNGAPPRCPTTAKGRDLRDPAPKFRWELRPHRHFEPLYFGFLRFAQRKGGKQPGNPPKNFPR